MGEMYSKIEKKVHNESLFRKTEVNLENTIRKRDILIKAK